MRRGSPRTRSLLPGLWLCNCFIHIGLRSGATGPPRFRTRLDLLFDICRTSFRCRRCRGHRWRGFPTQAKLFRQRGPVLGIRGCRERMIAPQTPPLPVFIPVQAMADAEMPSQHLAAVATVKAHHIIMAHRLPDRHSRGQNLCWLSLLSKLADVRCTDTMRSGS